VKILGKDPTILHQAGHSSHEHFVGAFRKITVNEGDTHRIRDRAASQCVDEPTSMNSAYGCFTVSTQVSPQNGLSGRVFPREVIAAGFFLRGKFFHPLEGIVYVQVISEKLAENAELCRTSPLPTARFYHGLFCLAGLGSALC
jgi:hypothetical protein